MDETEKLIRKLPVGAYVQRMKYLFAVRWKRGGYAEAFQSEKDEDPIVALKSALKRIELE